MKTETKPRERWDLLAVRKDNFARLYICEMGSAEPTDDDIAFCIQQIRHSVDHRGVDYDILLVRRVASVTQPTEGTFTKYRD